MDYLVDLSSLPPRPERDVAVRAAGVTVRRALAPELETAVDWVRVRFGKGWAGEASVSFTRQPPSCFLAIRAGTLLGFACYDAVARGFFGPTGVDASARGVGIGHALLFATLADMRIMGYGYAVIGHVGPSAFYEAAVGALPIPGSGPGIYAGLLKTTSG